MSLLRRYAPNRTRPRPGARGKGRKLPVENCYGWLVNDKLDEFRSLLDSGS
jgi:hypothetical protein